MRRGHHSLSVAILATLLLVCGLAVPGQVLAGGLRFVAPPDGATVEPGQTVTVIVEPFPGFTPTVVGLLSPLIMDFREEPPFAFAVTIPSDAPLGPHTVTADGLDVKERPLEAELRLQIETTSPVIRIRVTDPPLFIATERSISVFGTFTDGVTREITRSRETTYSSSDPQVATISAEGEIQAVDNGTATITVTYKDQSTSFPIKIDFQKLTVPLDIKPKDPRNTINLNSGGHVRVAILSTADFSASTVNARTVEFGPAEVTPDLDHVRTRDVNRDGQDDLVLRFRIQKTGIQCGETTAAITGRTLLGDRIRGSDSIRVVGKACR